MCRARSVIDALASYPCGKYASAEDLRVGNAHDVVIEHDEVSVFAGRQRSQRRFLESGVCRPNGHRLKSFFARHLLFGKPAASRPVRRILPRNGSMKGEKWIHLLHWKIGSVGNDNAGVEERAPRVG